MTFIYSKKIENKNNNALESNKYFCSIEIKKNGKNCTKANISSIECITLNPCFSQCKQKF